MKKLFGWLVVTAFYVLSFAAAIESDLILKPWGLIGIFAMSVCYLLSTVLIVRSG